MKVSKMPIDPAFKQTRIVKWIVEVTDLHHLKIGEHWIADSGILTQTTEYEDGETYKMVYSISRKEIQLQPSFDEEAFKIDVAVGARVRLLDASNDSKRYVWDGRRPVAELAKEKP